MIFRITTLLARYFLAVFIFVALAACGGLDRNHAELPEFENNGFLDDFSWSGAYLDISDETANARATFWKPDGSIVFVVGRSTDNVVAYHLDEPWEISTASFSQAMELPGRSQHGLYLREDGMKMWVYDRTSIWTFELEEAWDIRPITEGKNTDFSDFVIRGHDIDFTPDGSMLFIDDRNAGAVFAVALDEPWDVSTGSLSHTLDISHQQRAVRGLEFLKDGLVMMLMDTGHDKLLQYDLDEPYLIMSARLVNAFDVSEQTRQGRGLSFNADRTSFYVTGRDEEKIFQYDLKTE